MERFKSKAITRLWDNYLGKLEEDHAKFSLHTYRELANGKTPKLAQIEEATGINPRRLKKLVKKRPITSFDNDHHIVAHGVITNETTKHLIEIDEKKCYVTSAFEGMFCSQLLGKPIRLHSTLADRDELVMIELNPLGMETSEDDLYISMINADEFDNSCMARMGETSFFIKDEDAAEQWLLENKELMAIPLSQAFQCARMILDDCYGVDHFIK